MASSNRVWTMRRREFLGVLGGSVALWPFAAHAQQSPRVARLGYLAPASNPDLQKALLGVLRDFGYVEGYNLAIEYRVMLGQSKSYDELAAELARLAPDAIVVVGTPAGARGETANHHHSHYPGARRRSFA
jgi:putative ABC transport system substrate-binding protein